MVSYVARSDTRPQLLGPSLVRFVFILAFSLGSNTFIAFWFVRVAFLPRMEKGHAYPQDLQWGAIELTSFRFLHTRQAPCLGRMG